MDIKKNIQTFTGVTWILMAIFVWNFFYGIFLSLTNPYFFIGVFLSILTFYGLLTRKIQWIYFILIYYGFFVILVSMLSGFSIAVLIIGTLGPGGLIIVLLVFEYLNIKNGVGFGIRHKCDFCVEFGKAIDKAEESLVIGKDILHLCPPHKNLAKELIKEKGIKTKKKLIFELKNSLKLI